jgi:hypothetical protein
MTVSSRPPERTPMRVSVRPRMVVRLPSERVPTDVRLLSWLVPVDVRLLSDRLPAA